MKKILLVGNFGSKNFGDELILRSALLIVRESGNEPWVLSAHPSETAKKYGVKSFARLPMGIRSLFSLRWISTIAAFFRCDAVLFAGGGLFVDRFFLAKWIWGVHGFLALIFLKPLLFVGQSFEVKKGATSSILRILMKRARLITVRDQSSYNYALSLGVLTDKLRLLPDMGVVILLEEAKLLPESRKNSIAVSLCQWGMVDSNIWSIAKKLESYEHIRCFAFQEGGDDDAQILHRLVSLLPGKNVEIISINDPDFLQKFAACEFALTMRLHACLVATAFGIPCVAIAYQDKVSNIMTDMGMSEACVKLNQSFDVDFDRARVFALNHPISVQALDLLRQNTYALRALLVSALNSL